MVPGDRIVTPSGRTGVLKENTVNMPNHFLVQFDSGELHWIVKHAVKPCSGTPPKKRKTTKAKSKKTIDNLVVAHFGLRLIQFPHPESQ
jgi:hypothetical protein